MLIIRLSGTWRRVAKSGDLPDGTQVEFVIE
jgi:hypothetical protein